MSTPTPSAQKKTRATLLMLAAVFGLPLVIAWVLTLGPREWWPAKTVNYGVLLAPPLQLNDYGVTDDSGSTLSLKAIPGDWFLVVLRAAVCAEACQRWMQIAQSVQRGVGRDSARITLAMLQPRDDELPAPEQNWLLPGDDKLINALRLATSEPQFDTALLIVDHKGHVVLLYSDGVDGPGVLKDLKRLLRATAR